MKLLIFGCGYSALRAAVTLRPEAIAITGTTRSKTSFNDLEKAGVRPAIFDGVTLSGSLLASLQETTHLLLSIAPQVTEAVKGQSAGSCDPVLRCLPADLELPNLAWIGYLSTVGVYGDWQGRWIDESTVCQPRSQRSIRRLEAESEWQRFSDRRQIPLSILRLAGIYGPGRNAFCNLQQGKAKRLIKPGQVFNRIHVDDIARAIRACINNTSAGIYNICDDEPAPPQDVVSYAATLMGVTPPVERSFDGAELTPMARSFYSENKRVSNRRSRELATMTYRFGNYREGLNALWRSGSWDNDQWLEPIS